jgi:hypothetical protein
MHKKNITLVRLSSLLFVVIFKVSAVDATCCVSCSDGLRICGGQVDASVCGGCSSQPSADEARETQHRFDLTLSVGNAKPQNYTVRDKGNIVIKDEHSGASFSVTPKLSSSRQLVELNFKRVYSIFGLEFSVDYASVKLDRNGVSQTVHKIGPISVWSAKYDSGATSG